MKKQGSKNCKTRCRGKVEHGEHGKRWSEWCGVRWRQAELEVGFEGMNSVEQMGSESTEVGWRSLERAG
jgi:hypothetical protein